MEPTTVTAGALAAAASAVTLALFGVDYYSLLYGFVGAALALSQAEAMGRSRAILYVSLSTLVGAVIGNVFVDWIDHKSRFYLIGSCLVGGIVAQALVAVLIKHAPALAEAAVTRLKNFIAGGPHS